MTLTRAPSLDATMPQMEYVALEASEIGMHSFVERSGPREVTLSLGLVHIVTVHQFIETLVRSTIYCAIAAANNASVKEPMLSEKLPPSRPREAVRASAFPLI